MLLDFKNNKTPFTLGVEYEIQVLDRETVDLVPKAPDILAMLKDERLSKEMFRSTLELITGVCKDVQEVRADLMSILNKVVDAGRSLDVVYCSTGTHPCANYNERVLSASERYHQLLDRNQWLIRRMAVYGLHVHIGMRNGDECIRFLNFFLQMVPHLIALSASSPYWRGVDTGLIASRPTMYESHPTSGLPYIVRDWEEFNTLYHNLLRVHAIESMKDIWWDIRPSPVYGTLEIRICDTPATMLELESIVAWIHLLAYWFEDHGKEFFNLAEQGGKHWILRENKWRAIRHGAEAKIVLHHNLEEIRLDADILDWIERFTPYTHRLGYEHYIDCIRNIVIKGCSSMRQRKVMQQTEDLREVIRYNVREFDLGEPWWGNC